MHTLLRIGAGALVAASAAGQIHVSIAGNDANTGTVAAPVRTILHAAAIAPAGGTVFLHAGTYGDEQGLVLLGDKDLVLQGDGADSTVLHPHSTLLWSLPVTAPGAPVVAPHRVGIRIAGVARVQLRDLTIDGERTAPPSGNLAGVYLQGGADVLLDRVVVRGCRASAFGGPGTALAVAVFGDVPTDPTTATLRACTLRDFGHGGLRAVARAELDLQEVEVGGSRGEALAPDQCGVCVESGAKAAIRHCRIGDLAGADGAAIRCTDQAAGLAIEGNHIGGVANGIDVRQVTPLTQPGVVRGNRVFAFDRAVRVRGNQGLVLTANTLSSASTRDPATVFDDTAAGNLWNGNRYAVPAGTPTLAVPGGTNLDATPLAGTGMLQALERVPCAGAPAAVVADDFDGDGRTDFATLDLTANGVGVTVGRRPAASWTTQAIPFGGPGLRPVALVAGDFDGQPGRDLVALTAPLPPLVVGAAVWVFANDGAGALTLLHEEPLPGMVAPTGLANASFNANPFDDLVVVDAGALPFTAGSGRTLLNAGNGATWFATPLPVAIPGAAAAVAAGDVDGDSIVDLAVVEGSSTDGRLHLLLGNGIGFFAAAPGSPLALPPQPSAVTIADFDGDGDRDVLVASTGGPLPLQRGALLEFVHDGAALQPRPSRPTDLAPQGLAVADLDVDVWPGSPRPDLLVLQAPARSIAVLAAHGAETGFVGGGAVTAVDGPVGFAAAHFDGDPFRDLVAAEPARGGVAILHGRPSASVATYGFGCPGDAGRQPRLLALGAPALPVQPNITFAVGIADALPLSLAITVLSVGPAPVLLPCGAQILSFDLVWLTAVDAAGNSGFSLPIPAGAEFRGLPVYLQAGVFDPAAVTSIVPGISLTAGLRLRLGD
ncbi:MAG: FG-GAP-like repeat-containing protein [Planctomycetota bacterium]